MTKEKHELDETVEDILQHYGIKGMSWGVRRTDAQIAAANNEGGGGGGGEEEEEVDESLLEEFGDKVGDMFDAFGKKLDSVGDAVKKKGMSILVGIFGKAGDGKLKKATPSNSKSAKKLKEAMIKYNKAGPTEQRLMRKGYTVSSASTKLKSINSSSLPTKSAFQKKHDSGKAAFKEASIKKAAAQNRNRQNKIKIKVKDGFKPKL